MPKKLDKLVQSRQLRAVGLAAGSLTAVALCVWLVVWFASGYVSRSDYQAVANAYNHMADADRSIGQLLAREQASLSEDDARELAGQIDDFARQTQSIGELRAVVRDRELAQAYREFVSVLAPYLQAERAFVSVWRAGEACDRASADRSAHQRCLDQLSDIESSGSPEITRFASNMRQAIIADDIFKYYDARDQYAIDIKNLQKSFTGASDKLRDTINQNL